MTAIWISINMYEKRYIFQLYACPDYVYEIAKTSVVSIS